MGDAGFDNPCFLPGYFAQAGAQDFDVVLADIGGDRQDRLKDIGGIESTAESGFNDGDVDLASGEEVERQRGYEFKKREFFFTRVLR